MPCPNIKMMHLPVPNKTKNTVVHRNQLYYATSCCMQGWRMRMEDAHCVFLEAPDDSSCAYFSICDGHSGGSSSRFVIENLHRYIMRRPAYLEGSIESAIHEAFLELDDDMRQNENVQREHSGTTACAVLIKNNEVYCANVGDSRAIAYVSNEVMPLSTDHKPSLPLEADRIIAAGYRVSNNRVNGTLAMSRSLGDYRYKNNTTLSPTEQAVSCGPDVRKWELNSSWKYIFIASDGVFENMTSEVVIDFIEEQLEEMKTPQEILEELFEICCCENGQGLGADNMTAILVFFVNNLPLEYQLHTLKLEPPKKKKPKRAVKPSPSRKYVKPKTNSTAKKKISKVTVKSIK